MCATKKRRWATVKRYIPLYLMMLPGMMYIIVNNYIPMAGIRIAFKQYNYAKGIADSKFVGLKNFEFLFKTKDAWTITRNTSVSYTHLDVYKRQDTGWFPQATWDFLAGRHLDLVSLDCTHLRYSDCLLYTSRCV